uniref:FIP-RBD domain-containing protein n=1 Tax=Oryzias melastigma TaxID=30732 RepID=A0A3B3CZA2_ORYME
MVQTKTLRPYSQLTREELICLVLKQESQLLEKQGKISELEQYIDNLLVRVIEEQPSILMSLSAVPKKVA